MKKTGIVFLIILMVNTVNAQDKDWGIELNVLWPFVPGVEIYTAKMTKTLWKNDHMQGDLTFGLLLRPGTDGSENAEIFREYGFNIGYRQYLIKQWHIELALYPSLAQEENNLIDNQDHEGLALTTELYTGYKFILGGDELSWYVLPQVGIGYTPIANLGPSSEENSFFPTINLQIGFNF